MWALSNLCRGKNPPPDFSKVGPAGTPGPPPTHPPVRSPAAIPTPLFTSSVFSLSTPPQVSPCLTVLSRLLFSSDPDVLAAACWALSYLSDGPNDKIQTVLDSGVCRRLVELLM